MWNIVLTEYISRTFLQVVQSFRISLPVLLSTLHPSPVSSFCTDLRRGVRWALCLAGGCSTAMWNVNCKVSTATHSGCPLVQFLTLALQGMQERQGDFSVICWTSTYCEKRLTSHLFLTAAVIHESFVRNTISLIGVPV